MSPLIPSSVWSKTLPIPLRTFSSREAQDSCIAECKEDSSSSASHVVILLAKKYPQYKIVNMDCLDYCATLNNLKEVENLPNYKFVEVISGDIL